jgi:hypothetical protein
MEFFYNSVYIRTAIVSLIVRFPTKYLVFSKVIILINEREGQKRLQATSLTITFACLHGRDVETH